MVSHERAKASELISADISPKREIFHVSTQNCRLNFEGLA